jgi:TPR repeat protein
MTTPKGTCAGIALIAALCAGFTLGLTAPAWGDEDELPPLTGFLKMIQDAESFERGVAAYYRHDYATVFRELRPLADQGNANAQHDLGVMYEYGLGVPEDGARAARWYRKAAEQGVAEAQNHLGAMYHEGLARSIHQYS